jgi:hypothetical protein
MINTKARTVASSMSLFNSAFFSASPLNVSFTPFSSISFKVGLSFSNTSLAVIISGLTFAKT